MCTPCLGERQPVRDQRLDLLLSQQVEQRQKVLSKPRRPEPFECLDTVGDHTLAAREKPATHDIESEPGDPADALPAPRTTRSQSLPAYRRDETIAHHPPTGTERPARLPEMGTTDMVKNRIHALAAQ
jgi:hypothetical protein